MAIRLDETDTAVYDWYYAASNSNTAIRRTLVASVVFHLVMMVVLPLTVPKHRTVIPPPRYHTVQIIREKTREKEQPKVEKEKPKPQPPKKTPEKKPEPPRVKKQTEQAVKTKKPVKKPEPKKPAEKPKPPPPAPAPEASANIEVDLKVPAWYLDTVREKIWNQWQEPAIVDAVGDEIKVVIVFTISRSGEILSPKIEKPSGDARLDTSAMRAVYDSDPLPPLPMEYEERTLRIHFGFVYEQQTPQEY